MAPFRRGGKRGGGCVENDDNYDDYNEVYYDCDYDNSESSTTFAFSSVKDRIRRARLDLWSGGGLSPPPPVQSGCNTRRFLFVGCAALSLGLGLCLFRP